LRTYHQISRSLPLQIFNQDEEEALPEASELEEAERNPVKKWMRKSQ
jgi:hypothetical protein